MPSYPVNHSLYVLLWNKYKPVLLKLMKDADEGPQEYQFISHEFRDLNPKEKGGHSFTLEANKRRALNNIKMSVVAQDLLEILLKSHTASELLENSIYEFKMSKQFLFTVTKKEMEVETKEEDTESSDEAPQEVVDKKEKEKA